MSTSGYVQTPGCFIHRKIIPAAFAANVEPFDYVVSGFSGIGIGCENQAEEYHKLFQVVTVLFNQLSFLINRYEKLNYASEVNQPFK
jgi:hypothetical protein